MTLIHVDAHSDLYRNRSWDLNALNDMEMGCDDYIWYGIRDGFISRIFWVIPDGLYDLSSTELFRQFIAESMIIKSSYEKDMMEIRFSANTRIGEKEIEYTICTIDRLPQIKSAELLTVATSPEFVPEAADCIFERVLYDLGAKDEEIERIMNMHRDMPVNENSQTYGL